MTNRMTKIFTAYSDNIQSHWTSEREGVNLNTYDLLITVSLFPFFFFVCVALASCPLALIATPPRPLSGRGWYETFPAVSRAPPGCRVLRARVAP